MTARSRTDCVVVGAGVIGLAVARALASAGREVVVLERHSRHGEETSTHNSGVIHAGLYYPPGSLKARHCLRGRDLLYDFCARRGVAHRRCGKLVVASDAGQEAALEDLVERARANGVDDVSLLDAQALRRMEPALRARAALWSPSSGVIDAAELMLALLGEAEDAGTTLILATSVDRVRALDGGGFELWLDGEEQASLRCRALVNAAGLHAVALARRIDGLDARHVPALHLAKGHYFSLRGRAPFSRLVYPLPEPGGLGVHLTLDVAGRARFGPDVQWLDSDDPNAADLRVDRARAAAFYPAIRRWWPALPDGALQPDYAGIRPKLTGPGSPAADFRIDGPEMHGLPGLVNLFGIESPGLTAALSIAEAVKAALRIAG